MTVVVKITVMIHLTILTMLIIAQARTVLVTKMEIPVAKVEVLVTQILVTKVLVMEVMVATVLVMEILVTKMEVLVTKVLVMEAVVLHLLKNLARVQWWMKGTIMGCVHSSFLLGSFVYL